MRYSNFIELNKKYDNEGDGLPNRDKMDDVTHEAYVNDCFDTYEGLGFAETFKTPYHDDELIAREGMKFKVERRASHENGEVDLECQPIWHIRFEDGFTSMAYPEEICLAERA